jgi:nucleotide-binding universal stress UspA family protein
LVFEVLPQARGGFMFNRILIPVVQENLSERAARMALDFAKLLGAHVVFTYALTEKVPTDFGHEIIRPWKERAASLGIPCESRLADGYTMNIGDAIAFEAGSADCDLIVMGTHAREGLNRLLMGSVSERVSRVAKVPVLLLRGEEGKTPSAMFKDILVPVDGSKIGRLALEQAKELALKLESQIHLVHVVPDVPLPVGDPIGGYSAFDYTTLAESLEMTGKQTLEQSVEILKPLVPKIHLHHAHADKVQSLILQTAKEQHVDLIVIGTHGYGGLSYLLLGSVAQAVSHHANVPVLLVRPVK